MNPRIHPTGRLVPRPTRLLAAIAALLTLSGCVVLTFDGTKFAPSTPRKALKTLTDEPLFPPRHVQP